MNMITSTEDLPKNHELKVTPTVISNRYNISRTTINNWTAHRSKNRINCSSDGGRPRALDDIAIDTIKKTLIDKENETNPLSKNDTDKLFKKEKVSTEKRKYVDLSSATVINETNTSISTNTIKKYKEDNRIFDRQAQDLTPARLSALKDIRVTYKTAVMIMAYGKYLSAERKWNADATTIECRPDKKGQLVCVVREKGQLDHQVTSSSVPGELNLLVKYIGVGNAAGEIASPSIIIAIPSLHENDWHVEMVRGFYHNSSIAGMGYIYFAQTKCGTAELWRHWFTFAVIREIELSNNNSQEMVRTSNSFI